MKILVFTEGTCIIFASGKDVSREERVRMSQDAGVQQEDNTLTYENKGTLPSVAQGSVYDFASYIPSDGALERLTAWKEQGAIIYYMTSRRIKEEIDAIRNVLSKYHFPDEENLVFRMQGEEYKDVAERVRPDILIEDDCESIGGEKEMTYPHINPEFKKEIKSVVVKEFDGLKNLPDDSTKL